MYSTPLLITLQHALSWIGVPVLRAISTLGGFGLFLIVIPLIYWTVNRSKAHHLTLTLLVSIWLNAFLKDMVAISRPVATSTLHVFVQPLTNGFPSAIAQNGTVFWGTLMAFIKSVWFRIFGLVVIISIGISRIAVGADYPTDVLGGFILGLMLLIGFSFRRKHRDPEKGTIQKEVQQKQPAVGRKLLLFALISLLLMFLDTASTEYASLGLLFGWLASNTYALQHFPYREKAPIGVQALKVLVGYAGMAFLLLVNVRFVPVGLPEFLGFALVSVWVTLGAPYLFQRMGLAPIPGTATGAKHDNGRPKQLRAVAIAAGIDVAVVTLLTLTAVANIGGTHETVPAFADADSAVAQSSPITEQDGLDVKHTSLIGRPFAVLGHRGDAAKLPQETLPGFRQAVKLGVDLLDLDVRLTKDHHFVLLHNPTVDATTNGHGPVSDMTLKQVQSLDAGYWMTTDGGKTYPFRGKGIHLMSLTGFFKAFPHQQVNIEIKNDSYTAGSDLARVIAASHAANRVIVGSFYQSPLDSFRKHLPTARTMLSKHEMIQAYVWAHLGLEAYYTPPGNFAEVPETEGPLRVVTPGFVDFLHQHGVIVYVWTVDDTASMKRLMKMGVDGIISDNPGLLLQTDTKGV
ncbi:glycerophosphodiester phosphodiesterase family protein [Alicyclobacillus sp. SO9]|uniref:glycerophosphodiester phosphodiesterase family protein n=1 Tax=Alicyclobacillus sp. SO9 TaxID=2665646 RepID=UPI0018E8DB17|nr:glycerophosphodiester phosphodiesterase family protein [Alicyclobacillus sp. SO9]QQE78890.1 phosphatase PAP2 family protein [Alicyclobacillus sp. SO9]